MKNNGYYQVELVPSSPWVDIYAITKFPGGPQFQSRGFSHWHVRKAEIKHLAFEHSGNRLQNSPIKCFLGKTDIPLRFQRKNTKSNGPIP